MPPIPWRSSHPTTLPPDCGGDISQPATVDRIVIGALERFGHIDALVKNAGIFISKPPTDYTIGDYQLVVGVNLTGFFMVTQPVIAAMLKGGGRLGGCPRMPAGAWRGRRELHWPFACDDGAQAQPGRICVLAVIVLMAILLALRARLRRRAR